MAAGEDDDQDVLFTFERLDLEGHRTTIFIPRAMFSRMFRKMNDVCPVKCVGFDATAERGTPPSQARLEGV